MAKFVYKSLIKAPLIDVYAFHNDINNLPRLLKPPVKVEILNIDGNMSPGTRIELKLKLSP